MCINVHIIQFRFFFVHLTLCFKMLWTSPNQSRDALLGTQPTRPVLCAVEFLIAIGDGAPIDWNVAHLGHWMLGHISRFWGWFASDWFTPGVIFLYISVTQQRDNRVSWCKRHKQTEFMLLKNILRWKFLPKKCAISSLLDLWLHAPKETKFRGHLICIEGQAGHCPRPFGIHDVQQAPHSGHTTRTPVPSSSPITQAPAGMQWDFIQKIGIQWGYHWSFGFGSSSQIAIELVSWENPFASYLFHDTFARCMLRNSKKWSVSTT